jgi:hypothetical protein
VADASALQFLINAGFVETGDGHIELPAGAGENVPTLLAELQATSAVPARKPAAASSSVAATPADPFAGMSLKQKAVAMAEMKAVADRAKAKGIREGEAHRSYFFANFYLSAPSASSSLFSAS